MIPADIISKLKADHGEVYAASVGKYEVIFRPLTFAEMDNFAAHNEWSSAEAEDAIVAAAWLWPNYEEVIAKARPGHITSLAEEILENSHFLDPSQSKIIFEEARASMAEAHQVMKALVLAARSEMGYSASDLDNMTFTELAKIAALAEQVLQIKKAIYDPSMTIGISIMDPMESELDEEDYYNQQREFMNADKVNESELDGTGAQVVKERGTKFGTATVDDPIALQLKRAMGEI